MLRVNLPSRAADKLAAKLAPRFSGPYVVVKVYNKVNLALKHETGGTFKRAHGTQIKSIPAG